MAYNESNTQRKIHSFKYNKKQDMSENKWSTQLKKLGGNNKTKLGKTEGRKLANIKQEDNQLTNNKTTEWINISYQKKGRGKENLH